MTTISRGIIVRMMISHVYKQYSMNDVQCYGGDVTYCGSAMNVAGNYDIIVEMIYIELTNT